MSMGAPIPGSTVQPTPPQGGRGGGRPMPTPPGGGYPPMQPQVPAQGGKIMPQKPGVPMQPQVPAQGGKGPLPRGVGDVFPTPPGGGYPPMQPQVPAQGGKGNRPLPANYQSPYANYGFDSGFQNYLDTRYNNGLGMDGGHLEYNPTNQTFQTVGGMKAPGSGPDPTTSLANMQRTYEIQNQLSTMGPKPNANGMFSNMDMQNYMRSNPDFMALQNELYGIYNPGKTMPQFPPQKPTIPSQGGKIMPLLPARPQVLPARPQVLPARPQVMPAQSRPTNMAPQGLAGLRGRR